MTQTILHYTFFKMTKKSTKKPDFIGFLVFYSKLSVKVGIDISKTEEFKKIIAFCKKKQSIKIYKVHEVFKVILKTSEILLEEDILRVLEKKHPLQKSKLRNR